MLQLLIKSHKININECDNNGKTPLMLSGCTEYGFQKDNDASRKYGWDFDQTMDNCQQTRNFKSFELLLTQNDIDAQIKDTDGNYVFDICEASGKNIYMSVLQEYCTKRDWIMVNKNVDKSEETNGSKMNDNVSQNMDYHKVMQKRIENVRKGRYKNKCSSILSKGRRY